MMASYKRSKLSVEAKNQNDAFNQKSVFMFRRFQNILLLCPRVRKTLSARNFLSLAFAFLTSTLVYTVFRKTIVYLFMSSTESRFQ